MTPGENICSPAPVSPSRFSVANPSITNPMCETDEKPMTYLKSVWTMAMNAPYTTLTVASARMSGDQKRAPSGRSAVPTRKAAKAPSFISTPAWNIDTAVGAATWPSGDQLWKGKMPPSTAKPKKTNGNQKCWKAGENPACSIASRSNVFNPELKYIASPPTRATTEPMTRYNAAFIAAYSRVTCQPQMAISRYIGKTAIS